MTPHVGLAYYPDPRIPSPCMGYLRQAPAPASPSTAPTMRLHGRCKGSSTNNDGHMLPVVAIRTGLVAIEMQPVMQAHPSVLMMMVATSFVSCDMVMVCSPM